MRASLFAMAVFSVPRALAQDVVINEVCASNHGSYRDAGGRTPDWIELYNTGAKPIDLAGWRVAINGRQHVIDAPLRVGPKGYLPLLCDGKPERGPDHLGFTLDRSGGAILLIAPDATTITDLFTYPSLPADVSMGRLPDGAKTWSFMEQPSPGASNRTAGMHAVRSRCAAPIVSIPSDGHASPVLVTLTAEEGATTRYTLNGSEPTATHGEVFAAPLTISMSTVLRARAFRPNSLPSEGIFASFIIPSAPGSGLVLMMDPAHLWSDSTGIYATGAFNNNTRGGREWERDGALQWSGGEPSAVGVRLSGSGSRGAQKRSFKLYARDRHGSAEEGFSFRDGSRTREGILRADAGPHAFLRNMLLEELVRRHGLEVEVQPSVPVPLHLNAAYWGLYRWMPAKNTAWLEQRSGAEALDVLEGPAAVALSGHDDHFLRARQLLLHGAPIDSIDALIDTRSLIDLACIDLWTGRADHDLNVRCFRPRQPGGLWRWVLFDMDLWSLPAENSVERICSAALPETPFVPQLLAHPVLQQRLLARMTAMQATVFAEAGRVADSLYRAHEHALRADFKRWELPLDMPDPEVSLREVKGFAAARPAYLFRHMAERTGRTLHEVAIDVPPIRQGRILLEGLPLPPGEQVVRCFSGIELHIEALPAAGHEFAGWKGTGGKGPRITTDLSRTNRIRGLFREVLP